MRPRIQRTRGFVLGEVIIVLVVSSIVVVALLAGLIALIRGLQPQAVKIGGESLPIAPTFGSLPSAVRLHHTFAQRLTEARAVYVFGGRHLSLPAGSPPTQQNPLRKEGLPILTDFSPGLPMDAHSFYELYGSALGEQESSATTDDFTVLMVGPAGTGLAITCLVQVRRRELSISDGAASTAFTVREARLWEADGAAQRYVFAERPHLSGRVFVGAVHTWLRFRAGAAINEEGPACVVFPDPWVYGGSRARPDDIPPFSRFAYLLAVSP